MAEHTPGPWSYHPSYDGRQKGYVRCSETAPGAMAGRAVCRVTTGLQMPYDANAVRIVKCVNAMEPGGKVDALEKALRSMLATHSSDDHLQNTEGWLDARRDAVAALEPFNRED